jgi:hypothetical protein
VSPLDPDELARLLTQAVEPVRPGPEGFQRIREGIDRRRRMRLPLYTLVGVAAAALFVLAAIALQPGQRAQVVEPASPVNGSGGQSEPDQPGSLPENSKLGSGGGQDGGGGRGTEVPPGTTRTTRPPATSPSGTATTDPTSSPSGDDGGSPTMPPPASKPAKNGDIDGDGTADEIEMVNGTLLQARLSRGSQPTLVIPTVVTPLRYGVVDVDGNGFGEIFVQTGADNGVQRFAMLQLTSMEKISFVDDSRNALVAGIDTQGGSAAGFRCSPGSLTSYSGTSTGDGQYELVTHTWSLEGTRLVRTSSTTTGPTTDTSMFKADCGTL